jgi:PPK2 family polyphosphate:nucleotide phosphotransferase
MKIITKDFLAEEGKTVKLQKWPTDIKPIYSSKDDFHESQKVQIEEMSKLQNLLYAHNQYSILLIFQAMDAAGKDGAIKNVMSGINPQGCQVYSFKQPSAEELDHDFFWRTTNCLPERGRIGIFNRSYYEEVLVVKVHPIYLKFQNLPTEIMEDKNIWQKRYQSILDFEKHLYRNGTHVIKFYLNVSKEVQRKRFLERIDNPDKNWKFSASDIKERELWDQYMNAYEDCISATSTENSPWYIVPADDKKNTQLIITNIILEKMKELKMSYPVSDQKRIEELQIIRKSLEK